MTLVFWSVGKEKAKGYRVVNLNNVREIKVHGMFGVPRMDFIFEPEMFEIEHVVSEEGHVVKYHLPKMPNKEEIREILASLVSSSIVDLDEVVNAVLNKGKR